MITLLTKIGMPTVHLLLAVNNILCLHMIQFNGSNKDVLLLRKEVGVVPHSYHGSDGHFEGPPCPRILNSLEILEPYF